MMRPATKTGDQLPPEIAADFADMTAEERRYLLHALRDADSNRAALRALQDADFERVPVGIRRFLTDPELLGATGRIQDWDLDDDDSAGIYRFWRKELDDLFDPDRRYSQWLISCGIGAGKSFVSIVAILYKVYQLLCLRSPQAFLGINANSPIAFSFFSATRDIGSATERVMLTSIMAASPFFRRMANVGKTARPHEILHLPKGIRLAFGSRATHALGQNIYGGLLDEAAFGILREDTQMRGVFDGIWRRLSSRYANSISPGLLIMASSKASELDFLEKHIQKWATPENADSVKLTRGSLYTIKPHQFPAKDTFKIMIGNEVTPSRILAAGELPDPGFVVEEVPDHPALRAQFNADLEGSLRDISAIVVANESPLIPLREKLVACIDRNREHPFRTETVFAGMGDDLEIQQLFNHERVLIRKVSGWVPRINPGYSRYIGVDLGLKHDSTGIAICHLAGSRPAETLNELGESVVEEMPVVFVDMVLQVHCKPGDQIDLTKIAKFILFLARFCGYPIGGISFDQYQSAHISQILAKLNFPVSYVSVDRTEVPYLTLASIIQNEAISYYSYPPLLKELRELRRDLKRKKVDHPYPDGSKDCSDALAASVTSALKDKHSFAQPDLPPMTDRDFVLRGDASRRDPSDISWVTGGRRVKMVGMPEFVPRDIFGNPAVK